MNYQSMMESIADWLVAANSNGNLLFAPNGVQCQALSLTTSSGNSHQNNSLQNGSHPAKTISIRCKVESVPNVQFWHTGNLDGAQTEVERRANVPVHTTINCLVETVLRIFGYPKGTADTARGSLLLDHWQPLPLEKVPMDAHNTVDDVLGHISSYVTLRIQIPRTTSSSSIILAQMKDKLLKLLVSQNIELISSSGCPLDQITLKNILLGSDYGTSSPPPDDVLRKFEAWLASQSRPIRRAVPYPSPLSQFPYHLASPTINYDSKDLASGGLDDRMHSALQSAQNQQKTRMRTSFDPELELPKLQTWFNENQHPDRQQIRQYVDELNRLESRKGRKPLDVNNVVYWFKNARAAQKRNGSRNLSSLHTSMNGYRSDSQSPCDTPLTSKASLGSAQSCDEEYGENEDNRLEDEDGGGGGGDGEHDAERERDGGLYARPSVSPVARPLSLTTHKDNNNGGVSRNSSPVAEVKQEPPDRMNDERAASPASVKHSPVAFVGNGNGGGGGEGDAAGGESGSTDDGMETDDYASETESAHKSTVNAEAARNSSAVSFPNSSSPLSLIQRNNALFNVVPNYNGLNFSMFSMGQYPLGLGMTRGGGVAPLNAHQATAHLNNASNHSAAAAAAAAAAFAEDRRGKRNRTFIDPVTEVPCLEGWFLRNTHPSHSLIRQYTEDLNSMPYRQKFPRLETKNVQFWFKNRRAKCKRLKTSMYESSNNNLSPEQFHQFAAALSNEGFRNQD